MYPINPFQPVSEIVGELATAGDDRYAGIALSRSISAAIREGYADAVIRLALAHCVWADARLSNEVLADMVEIMLASKRAQELS